jgi:hypothetical protein
MRHIKRINELFDDFDIKSQMEIPYLRGDLSPDKLIKNLPVNTTDPLFDNIILNCPFVKFLMYGRPNSSLLNIGYQKTIQFDAANNVIIYYIIEIMENKSSKTVICNVRASCFGNGQKLYYEEINKPFMSYEKLFSFLNSEALDLLIDFTKYTEKMFNFKQMPYPHRDYMKYMNTGRN